MMSGDSKNPPTSMQFYGQVEEPGSKLLRKTREEPLFPIGIAGLLGVVGWGIYKYRYRGGMSTSVYLMQLRVMAQSAVVVCLTLGVGYKLISDFVRKDK